MNISSTSLSGVTATPATGAVNRVQDSDATSAASNDGDADDKTRLTTLGQLMSKLQSLESTDPAKAKQVLSSIAAALTDKANSGSTTDPRLAALADKFTQAAKTGDLSGLQPPAGGGHHHHHHHAAAPAASASADSATGATSSKAASYARTGDVMSQVESVISDALTRAGV